MLYCILSIRLHTVYKLYIIYDTIRKSKSISYSAYKNLQFLKFLELTSKASPSLHFMCACLFVCVSPADSTSARVLRWPVSRTFCRSL